MPPGDIVLNSEIMRCGPLLSLMLLLSRLPGGIDLGSIHTWCQPICIPPIKGFEVILAVAQPQEVFAGWGQWLKILLWMVQTGVLHASFCSACAGLQQWAGCRWAKGEISELITFFFLKKENRCSPFCLGCHCLIWIILRSDGSALACNLCSCFC